jgi:hypothetical protein
MVLDNFYEKLYKMLEDNNPPQNAGNQAVNGQTDQVNNGNDQSGNGQNDKGQENQNDNTKTENQNTEKEQPKGNDQNQNPDTSNQPETFTLPTNIKIEDLKPFVNQVLGKDKPSEGQSQPAQGNQGEKAPTAPNNNTATQNNVNTNNNVNANNNVKTNVNNNQPTANGNKNWARKLGTGLKDVGGLAVDAAKAAGQIALEAPGAVKSVANSVNELTDNWNNGEELR